MALVFCHAVAGDRDCSGGTAGAGGSLHVFAGDWAVSVADVGSSGIMCPLALSPRSSGWQRRHHSGDSAGLRAHPDFVLAQ